MNGYKIVLLKAIFMLYRLPECERVCSGICIIDSMLCDDSQISEMDNTKNKTEAFDIDEFV